MNTTKPYHKFVFRCLWQTDDYKVKKKKKKIHETFSYLKHNLWSSYLMFVSGSGEDLVSEQTRQREEDKQEEAAAFPAGVYNDAHPTCAGWTRRPSNHHQPQQQHLIWHDIRGILAGFHAKDWYSMKHVHSVFFLFFFYKFTTERMKMIQHDVIMLHPLPFRNDKHVASDALIISQDLNVVIWMLNSTKILIKDGESLIKNCWLKPKLFSQVLLSFP